MIATLALAALLNVSGTVSPAGATVQAYDANGVLAVSTGSDAAGHYSLAVAAGKYHLLAFDPNGNYATSFYPDAESFETSALLDVESNTSNINFALVRAGFVAGVVTSNGGTPLGSMTVAAYNADGTRRGFTTTDAAGNYRLVLPPGTFDVAAFDNALVYQPSVVHGVVVATASTATTDFKLTKSATVSGTITDALTSSPLASMSVAFYVNGTLAATATTDANGRYRLLLPPATYGVVSFDPLGVYAPTFNGNVESFDRSVAVVLAEGTSTTIDAKLVRAAKFSGHVTDAATHAALPGITVAAFNADGTTRVFATTDGGGLYTLVLPAGTYRVAAYDTNVQYARRFYPAATSFASAAASSAFTASSTILDFALPRGAVVSGQVTAAGTTPAGIAVAAYDASGLVTSTLTDANGNYRLVVDGGSYVLAAFDPSFRYATSSTPIATVAGQPLGNKNFSLVSGAHLSGLVTTSAGFSLADMTVAAYDASDSLIASAITRSDGRFDFVVPPGTYRLAAFDPLLRFDASPLTAAQSFTAGESVANFVFTLHANDAVSHRRAARH